MTLSDDTEGHRLDKWLWHCRFYKTRSTATAAIAGGKVHLNAERVKYWLSVGAQPSDTVRSFFTAQKIA